MNHFQFDVTPAYISKRPSQICKSPYMADICFHDDDPNITHLAHSPSLGCSGLTDKNCSVFVTPISSQTTKSKHRISFSVINESWENENFQTIVCTYPQIAEQIIEHSLQFNLLKHLRASSFQPQTKIGHSRFDFSGIDTNGTEFIAEVKTVPIADYHNVNKKMKTQMIKNNTFYNRHPYQKIAFFPDGYIKPSKDATPKPQSERANKHILELTHIKQSSPKRTIMFYVVQRNDFSSFNISQLDPIYRENVHLALKAGVEIYIITMHWKYENNSITGSIINQQPYSM